MTIPSVRPGGTAFSQYKPSVNAHTDFLYSNTSNNDRNKGKDVRVVRLKPKTQYTEKPIQDDLTHLIESIGPILRGQQVKHSFHCLSAACHRLVLPPHNAGHELYSNISRNIEQSLEELTKGWQRLIMAREPDFLARFIADWRAWEKRVELLSSVFVYLDRIYVGGNIASIRQLAVDTFARCVWGQDIIRGKIVDSIMTWVTEERTSSQTNPSLRQTVVSIVDLSRLLGVFESLSTPYVGLANTHYSEVAESNMTNVEAGTMSPTAYIEWVGDKVKSEEERGRATMSSEVASQVVNVVRVQAGYKMSKRIVSRALEEAMDLSDGDALSRLYGFSVDVQVFGEFVECLKTHIEGRLKKLISDPANDSKMIEETLVLKRFADRSIAGLFDRDNNPEEIVDEPMQETTGLQLDDDDDMENTPSPIGYNEAQRKLELEDAVRKGFRAGMSSRENAPAEWIAKHLDAVMRRGQGSGIEAEFDSQLEEIIALVGFTPDKDVFKAFYSTQLAKRLLLNKSASDDMERNMIIKLQKEMGEEFTSGDVMMKDLQLSETLVRSYQTARSKNPDAYKDPGNLTANVLTESAWPAYPQLKDGWNFKLTPELQSSIDAFTEWYATQHRNRQLSWRPQLGTVTLTARFESGKYEIGVSLFQAIVLLHFNDDNALEVGELQARTGIEQKELVRVLQSLSMGRKGTRVLVKKPPGKEVAPTDSFLWNKTFNSDRIKFRINQIQQDLSAEESKKTNEQVAIDRVSVLEATIVRIMKGRKTLTLQLLIDAVVVDVSKRFPPDVKEMKKRVENLIEREFLMRDEDDRNLLHYLA